MPAGQLTINGQDAYNTWGVSMDSSALSALMTPAPIKSLTENDSRIENGKVMITAKTTGDKESLVKVDARDVTITFYIRAKSESEFLTRYYSFCKELETGKLDISTSFLPNVVFHMIYVSCNQFSEYMRGLGKFALKLTEPNPKNRT